MRGLALAVALAASCACPATDAACPQPTLAVPDALVVDWTGGVYGIALPDGGTGPVMLADGGQAPGDLVPVSCGIGTLTGPVQLFSEGDWQGVGRVVRGQYEWCAGAYSGDDLHGIYGSGPGEDGFTAFLASGMHGGLGVYQGHTTATEITGTVSGLGLEGYRWRITTTGAP
jgi:hypothetical protein